MSNVITTPSPVIDSYRCTIGSMSGILYKLADLLPVELRRSIAGIEGVHVQIVQCEYAPEIRRTGIFVEDGYSYSVV